MWSVVSIWHREELCCLFCFSFSQMRVQQRATQWRIIHIKSSGVQTKAERLYKPAAGAVTPGCCVRVLSEMCFPALLLPLSLLISHSPPPLPPPTPTEVSLSPPLFLSVVSVCAVSDRFGLRFRQWEAGFISWVSVSSGWVMDSDSCGVIWVSAPPLHCGLSIWYRDRSVEVGPRCGPLRFCRRKKRLFLTINKSQTKGVH